MIDGIGKSGPGRIDLNRSPVGASAQASRAGQVSSPGKASPAGGAVADIVSSGAPIDSAKVEAIRAAIRDGRYPVDPEKIAARMIEFDLPAKA